jgi:hypothetical protein
MNLGVKLTTHLQLVPRSRKYGSIHPLPHMPLYVVLNLLSTETNLPFILLMLMNVLYHCVSNWWVAERRRSRSSLTDVEEFLRTEI